VDICQGLRENWDAPFPGGFSAPHDTHRVTRGRNNEIRPRAAFTCPLPPSLPPLAPPRAVASAAHFDEVISRAPFLYLVLLLYLLPPPPCMAARALLRGAGLIGPTGRTEKFRLAAGSRVAISLPSHFPIAPYPSSMTGTVGFPLFLPSCPGNRRGRSLVALAPRAASFAHVTLTTLTRATRSCCS